MVCQHCGNAVTVEAPAGLCPGCLIRTAVALGGRDPIPELPRLRYFGDYELLEEIARGGMGVVYKARQISLDRVVALKMMRPGLLATAEEVARFRAEAASAARLQHPNIVRIFEVGEQDGLHYFSMDYVEGANLALVAGGRPLPVRQAADYVKTVAEAIDFAHAQGTLHRDLKPSNILIDLADRPRITDFGLALPLQAGVAADSSIAGTPAYMAPEQVAGDELSAATDVYGLGAILRELAGGERLDRDLETICAKCTAQEPRRRYRSAGELAQDLGRYLRREPIRARRIGAAARAWRWVRRNPWQTTAAAALAIAAGVAYRSTITFREQYFGGLLEQARLERLTGNMAGAAKLVRKAAAIHDNRATLQEAVELAAAPGAELLMDIPFGWVLEVRFSSNGEHIAVQGAGYVGETLHPTHGPVVKVWDVVTGKLRAGDSEWPAQDGRSDKSPDGKWKADLLVQGSHGELAISDAATGQRVAMLADNHSPVWSTGGLMATIGGNRVATAGGSMGSDRRVAPGVVMGTSWVRVWRVKNFVPSYVVGETVREIVVRRGEKRIIAKEGEWVIGTNSLRRVSGTRDIPEMGDGQRREWLATSVDARQAAVGCWPHGKVDGTVELWDMQKRERLAALDATVRAWPDGGARFSADGALLVVQELHVNNDLKVFDAATGRLLQMIRMSARQRAFAFAGARQTVSVGSGARVVDIGTGREVRRWAAGSMEAQDRAVAVGGGQIATAGEDRMIHLWDMEGRERVRWTAHTSDVTALAFDEAGQVLYSGAEDGSVKVWDLGKIRAEVARLGVSW